MIFLAATLSMEGGATIGDIRSDRSQILYRIMNAANLLRKMNVNHLGLFLLRDEFLTIPMSIVDMFDIVLRHHYGRNEINHSSRVMWLPLGWDPGYVQKTDTSISYIPASKRKYLAACLTCSIGQSSTTGSVSCTKCDLGTYGSSPGVCTTCIDKKQYQDTKGKKKCLSCTLGEKWTSLISSCTKCTFGQYGSENGTCVNCNAGKFQDEPGKHECKDCSVDTYLSKEGKSSKADCTDCSSEKSTGNVEGNIAFARCMASFLFTMNAPFPYLTSRTSASAPPDSFLDMIEATINGILGTVPVTLCILVVLLHRKKPVRLKPDIHAAAVH